MWRQCQVRYAFITYLQRMLLLVSISQLPGCSSVGYYWQALGGHLEIKSCEQPVSDLLTSPELDAELRNKLLLAQQARRFASEQLALPDNASYTMYADLQRPYVIWNVVATPEFSIVPRQWCYLLLGCLNYRGFFDKQEAQDYAGQLQDESLDTALSGATAYSTLGYFDDPLLNTMVRRNESELVGVIFHELAHQLVYAKGDTAFNESFASSVEQEGVRRWYAAQGDEAKFRQYLHDKQQRQAIFVLLKTTRSKLDALYRRESEVQVKRAEKAHILAELKSEYHNWRSRNDYAGFDSWFAQDLNNAHLALIATYHDLVPNFLALLDSVDGNLPLFYKKVEQLVDLPLQERRLALGSTGLQE